MLLPRLPVRVLSSPFPVAVRLAVPDSSMFSMKFEVTGV